jgi:uncharacterized protein YcbK (DUF882 family)
MGNATKHFSYWEFGCNCGKACEESDGRVINPLFLQKLEFVRVNYGKIMKPTSGCRCPYWNQKVGGVRDSFHLLKQGCRAADFEIVDGRDRHALAKLATKIDLSIGFSSRFIHLDDRPPVDRRIFLY